MGIRQQFLLSYLDQLNSNILDVKIDILTYQNYAPNRLVHTADFDSHNQVFPYSIVLLQYDKYNPCCNHWLEIFQDQQCIHDLNMMKDQNNQNSSTSLNMNTVTLKLQGMKFKLNHVEKFH